MSNYFAMNTYVCPECEATAESTPVECCDYCILKFYYDNKNASHLQEWGSR
jgi:hypothetical protein